MRNIFVVVVDVVVIVVIVVTHDEKSDENVEKEFVEPLDCSRYMPRLYVSSCESR
jgi:hypothetical protein